MYGHRFSIGFFLIVAVFVVMIDSIHSIEAQSYSGIPSLPTYKAQRLFHPPFIDGKVDSLWQVLPWSEPLKRFRGGKDEALERLSVRFKVGYTNEALYLLVEGTPGAYLKGNFPLFVHHDEPIWQDIAVEVFISPQQFYPGYYQFITNRIDARFEHRNKENPKIYNAYWESAYHETPTQWNFEIAIPFQSLETQLPEEGEKWRFNITYDALPGQRCLFSWADMEKSFHEPNHFGRLIFQNPGQVKKAYSFYTKTELDTLSETYHSLKKALLFYPETLRRITFDYLRKHRLASSSDRVEMILNHLPSSAPERPFLLLFELLNSHQRLSPMEKNELIEVLKKEYYDEAVIQGFVELVEGYHQYSPIEAQGRLNKGYLLHLQRLADRYPFLAFTATCDSILTYQRVRMPDSSHILLLELLKRKWQTERYYQLEPVYSVLSPSEILTMLLKAQLQMRHRLPELLTKMSHLMMNEKNIFTPDNLLSLARELLKQRHHTAGSLPNVMNDIQAIIRFTMDEYPESIFQHHSFYQLIHAATYRYLKTPQAEQWLEFLQSIIHRPPFWEKLQTMDYQKQQMLQMMVDVQLFWIERKNLKQAREFIPPIPLTPKDGFYGLEYKLAFLNRVLNQKHDSTEKRPWQLTYVYVPYEGLPIAMEFTPDSAKIVELSQPPEPQKVLQFPLLVEYRDSLLELVKSFLHSPPPDTLQPLSVEVSSTQYLFFRLGEEYGYHDLSGISFSQEPRPSHLIRLLNHYVGNIYFQYPVKKKLLELFLRMRSPEIALPEKFTIGLKRVRLLGILNAWESAENDLTYLSKLPLTDSEKRTLYKWQYIVSSQLLKSISSWRNKTQYDFVKQKVQNQLTVLRNINPDWAAKVEVESLLWARSGELEDLFNRWQIATEPELEEMLFYLYITRSAGRRDAYQQLSANQIQEFLRDGTPLAQLPKRGTREYSELVHRITRALADSFLVQYPESRWKDDLLFLLSWNHFQNRNMNRAQFYLQRLDIPIDKLHLDDPLLIRKVLTQPDAQDLLSLEFTARELLAYLQFHIKINHGVYEAEKWYEQNKTWITQEWIPVRIQLVHDWLEAMYVAPAEKNFKEIYYTLRQWGDDVDAFQVAAFFVESSISLEQLCDFVKPYFKLAIEHQYVMPESLLLIYEKIKTQNQCDRRIKYLPGNILEAYARTNQYGAISFWIGHLEKEIEQLPPPMKIKIYWNSLYAFLKADEWDKADSMWSILANTEGLEKQVIHFIPEFFSRDPELISRFLLFKIHDIQNHLVIVSMLRFFWQNQQPELVEALLQQMDIILKPMEVDAQISLLADWFQMLRDRELKKRILYRWSNHHDESTLTPEQQQRLMMLRKNVEEDSQRNTRSRVRPLPDR